MASIGKKIGGSAKQDTLKPVKKTAIIVKKSEPSPKVALKVVKKPSTISKTTPATPKTAVKKSAVKKTATLKNAKPQPAPAVKKVALVKKVVSIKKPAQSSVVKKTAIKKASVKKSEPIIKKITKTVKSVAPVKKEIPAIKAKVAIAPAINKVAVKKTIAEKVVAKVISPKLVTPAITIAKETAPLAAKKILPIKIATKKKAEPAPLTKKRVSLKGPTPLDKVLYPRYFFKTDIPEHYNENYLRALPRDPDWIFVYWEFTSDTFDRLEKTYGSDLIRSGRRLLRLRDITDGISLSRYFDVEISDYADNWYVKVPEQARTYLIQCGILLRDGRFVEILSSNVFSIPRAGVSDKTDEEWLTVNTDELIRVSSEPFYKPLGASDTLGENNSLTEGNELSPHLGMGSSDIFMGSSDLYAGSSNTASQSDN